MWNKHKDNVVNAKGEYEKQFNNEHEELKKEGYSVDRPNLNRDSPSKRLNRAAEMKDRRKIHPNNYDLYYGAHGKASTPYQKAYSREMLNPVGAEDEDEAYMQARDRARVSDDMAKGHELLKELATQGMEWDDAIRVLEDEGYNYFADSIRGKENAIIDRKDDLNYLEDEAFPNEVGDDPRYAEAEARMTQAQKALERMKKTHGFKNDYDRYQFLKDAGYIR